MHHRHAVAALRFVREVGREEDRDAVVSRKIDQGAPKRVARDGVDAGGRLVENEDRGFVQHRHGELQSLLDAERQAVRPSVGEGFEIVPPQKLLDALRNFGRRQVVELRNAGRDSAARLAIHPCD
jgi:hypothetical protein